MSLMNSIGSFRKSFKGNYAFQGLIIVGIALVLGLTQDFVHSSIEGYTFYFSESLLFNSFWVLFIPIAWLQARIKRLNNWDLKKYGVLRICVLTISATIIHLLLFPWIVKGLSIIFLDHTFYFTQVLEHAISEKSYLTIAIYTLISVILFKKLEKRSAPIKAEYLTQLSLSHKSRKVIIAVSEITSIHAENPYIKLITSRGEFLQAQTLKSIAEKLNPEIFIRVHKSAIISTKEVVSYKSRQNGDYDITLTNGSMVRMSRNFSSEFKKRFF